MARHARRDIVPENDVGLFHCIQRCVRRAFLCGFDPLSQKNFDHRKAWVEDRLRFLAGIFGVDVCSYAVMSNHLHVILRIRPDLTAGWSDEEVARRWWRLSPQRRDPDTNSPVLEPTEHDLNPILANPARLAELRQRLGSLSWFMRALAEWIARQANGEDLCTGRFWEGRFKSQALLDESAVLACSLYVDLNPVRAGLVDDPLDSPHTSGHDRHRAIQAERPLVAEAPDLDAEPARAPSWLSPVHTGEGRKAPGPAALPFGAGRASDKGFLPIGVGTYLSLLEWVASTRPSKRTRGDRPRPDFPREVGAMLEQSEVSAEIWRESVWDFGRRFQQAAGRVGSLACEAQRRGQRWLQGRKSCQAAFG